MSGLKEILIDVFNNGGSYEYKHWKTKEMTNAVVDGEEVCKEMLHGDSEHFDGLVNLRPEKIQAVVVDSYGGEDQGSEYYHVWKFTMDNETAFVRFDGTYASHYGTDFDGWKFVTPREKTVIVYE
jgi:hypothetical protein